MITSKTGQTSDTANYIHGCFMVRVGSDFSTYKEIMEWAQQDEIFGKNGKPALDPAVKQILSASSTANPQGSDNGPLPVYFS